MIIDELWKGGPKIYRSPDVLPLGTDSVLLSHFASEGTSKKICDLGCGSGIISILLGFGHPDRKITGIEIQHHAAEIAAMNAELNGLSGQIEIKEGDLREHRLLGGAGEYDLVVSNPPYFPVNSGKSADSDYISIAREEILCSLADVCRAAAYFTRWGGRFALVHRPERLSEICCCLTENGLEPKRLRFVHSRPDTVPNLLLIESRRGGKPGIQFEKPLIISNEDGSDTEEIKEIYSRRS